MEIRSLPCMGGGGGGWLTQLFVSCVGFLEFMLSLSLYLARFFMFFLPFSLDFAVPPVSCPCIAALDGLVAVRSSRSILV